MQPRTVSGKEQCFSCETILVSFSCYDGKVALLFQNALQSCIICRIHGAKNNIRTCLVKIPKELCPQVSHDMVKRVDSHHAFGL